MVQKAKSEYSPLGKVLNKGLDESAKKEGPLKDGKILKARIKIS